MTETATKMVAEVNVEMRTFYKRQQKMVHVLNMHSFTPMQKR